MKEQKLYRKMDLYSLIEVVQKTENLLATEELLKRTKELIYRHTFINFCFLSHFSMI